MKKRLIIIGAGGLGKELYSLLITQPHLDCEVSGFLDDNLNALKDWPFPHRVLGSIQDYRPKPNEVFLTAIGSSKVRLHLCRTFKDRGANFITYIHPDTTIGHSVQLDPGCIIYPGVRLTAFITIGAYTLLTLNATVGHNAAMGEGCTLSGHSEVNGGCSLGEGVLLGSHATVLPLVKIGDYAVVGAGSVAVKDVPPHTTVMGVPAIKLFQGTSDN